MKILLINKNGYSNAKFLSSSTRIMSAASPTSPLNANSPSQKIGKRDPLDTSFDNHIDAFKSKTTVELIRAYLVYVLCSSEYLVENNMKVINYSNI